MGSGSWECLEGRSAVVVGVIGKKEDENEISCVCLPLLAHHGGDDVWQNDVQR